MIMNPVQQKVSCVYITAIAEESSNKRKYQPFKVSATKDLTDQALKDGVLSAEATEKFDGTCCLIEQFQGQPWLWARHDRKPSSVGERKFNQFKRALQKEKQIGDQGSLQFSWDPVKDFKEVPEHWIPASRLEIRNGLAMPDNIGHTPGWIPVELTSRQHCWHLSAVDYTRGLALVLREDRLDSEGLIIESQPLSLLCGQTCELVGTNINGNPYKIGRKKCPIHVLIPHGSMSLSCPLPSDYDSLYNWFDSTQGCGQVEGIVWHCANGELHKLHRHHLNLKWPVSEPRLCQRRVKVQVEVEGEPEKNKNENLFSLLSNLNGQTFHSVQDLSKSIDAADTKLS